MKKHNCPSPIRACILDVFFRFWRFTPVARVRVKRSKPFYKRSVNVKVVTAMGIVPQIVHFTGFVKVIITSLIVHVRVLPGFMADVTASRPIVASVLTVNRHYPKAIQAFHPNKLSKDTLLYLSHHVRLYVGIVAFKY